MSKTGRMAGLGVRNRLPGVVPVDGLPGGDRMNRETTTARVRPQKMILALTTLLAIGFFPPPTSAVPPRQCVRSCKTRNAACLATLRSQRPNVKAACAGTPDPRECRQQARRPRADVRAACRRAKISCQQCCRADGEPCRDLGLVPVLPRSASAAIGEAGGTLTAAGLDGTTYRLEVPAGALVSEATITMTPLAGVTNLPLSRGVAAAVQFAPDGLAFLVPATLIVTFPDATDMAGLVGFGFRRAGEGVHLTPSTPDGRQLTFSVTHFSGIGAGGALRDDIAAFINVLLPDEAGAFLSSEVAENLYTSQIAQLMVADVRDPLAYQQVLREWFSVSLGVTLANTFLESGVNQALLEYLGWKAAIGIVSTFLGIDFELGMAEDIRNADSGMARVLLVAGVNAADARCRVALDLFADFAPPALSAANDAIAWARIMDGLDLLPVAPGSPTFDDLVRDLCVNVSPLEARLVPDPPTPGGLAELRVRAALTFRRVDGSSGGAVFGLPLSVTVAASGLADPVAGGSTDEIGIFSTEVRRNGNDAVQIGVRTCVDRPELPHVRLICGEVGLAVAGSTTTTTTSTTVTTTTVPSGTPQLELFIVERDPVSGQITGFVDSGRFVGPDAFVFEIRARLLLNGAGFGDQEVTFTLDPPPPAVNPVTCPACGFFLRGADVLGSPAIGSTDRNGLTGMGYHVGAGNGAATITATHAGLSDSVSVTFEETLSAPSLSVSLGPPSNLSTCGSVNYSFTSRGAGAVTVAADADPDVLVTGGGLPSPTGVVSGCVGTSSPPGSYSVTWTFTDEHGLSSVRTLTFTIANGVVTVNEAG